MPKTTKVAIYARVSTAEQDPEVQVAAIREAAAQRGWQITETYVDHGVSGVGAQPTCGRPSRVPCGSGTSLEAWSPETPLAR